MSVFAMAVNYLISLILTPFITTHISTEAYGFVTLAKTVSDYGIIITGCLNAFAGRYIAIAYHENKEDKVNEYYSSVVIANVLLLAFVMVAHVFFIWKLEFFLIIPDDIMTEVKILFSLDIMNNMFHALVNTFSASAYVTNRLDIIDRNRLISYIFQAVILWLFYLLLPAKIYYVGIALIVSNIVLGLLNYNSCRRLTPDVQIKCRHFSFSAVKDLVVSGIWNSINNIGNLLNSGLDLLVSNWLLSAKDVGELSIVKTISTIISTLIQLLSRPFQPYLLKYYSEKKVEDVIRVFKLEIKFSSFFSNTITIGLICFGNAYYRLWVPNQNIELLQGLTIVTVILYIFEGMIQPLFFVYTLTLHNKKPCIVTIVSGILNVTGMFILLTNTQLGLYAVVGTTTVLGIINYCVFTPLYTTRCMGIEWYTFYPAIIRASMSFVIALIISWLLFNNRQPSSWITLIIDCVLCSIICGIVHVLVAFNMKEKTLLATAIKSKISI